MVYWEDLERNRVRCPGEPVAVRPQRPPSCPAAAAGDMPLGALPLRRRKAERTKPEYSPGDPTSHSNRREGRRERESKFRKRRMQL